MLLVFGSSLPRGEKTLGKKSNSLVLAGLSRSFKSVNHFSTSEKQCCVVIWRFERETSEQIKVESSAYCIQVDLGMID